MIYNKEKISERIRKERKNLNINQSQLAVAIGYSSSSRQTIGNWEDKNNNTVPNINDLFKLCEVFECELGYLLGEYETKTRDVADIREITGLSETAINNLVAIKNSPYMQILDILNKLLEHMNITVLLKEIYTYVWNFNENRFSNSEKNLKKIADIMNCDENEAEDYMRITSESLIKSTLMSVINDIYLFKYNTPKSQKMVIKQKKLFDFDS